MTKFVRDADANTFHMISCLAGSSAMLLLCLAMELLRIEGSAEILALSLKLPTYLFLPIYSLILAVLTINTWDYWHEMLKEEWCGRREWSRAIEFIDYAFCGNPIGIILIGMNLWSWWKIVLVQLFFAVLLYGTNRVASLVTKKKLS